MKALHDCYLYGILDLGYTTPDEAPVVLGKMLEGGVDIVQLRAKNRTPSEIAALATRLAPVAREADVHFIINDHPVLVAATGATGAHVGQDDLSFADARRLAGDGAIVGKSTHSIAQAIITTLEGPDYIGFGPLFATATKPDYVPIGLEQIAEVHKKVNLPIFCIGGIKLENLPEVIAAGAQRVVIVSGILQAPDIAGYCREVKQLLLSAAD